MSLVRKPGEGPQIHRRSQGTETLTLNTTLHKVGSRLNTQRWSHSHGGLVGHSREAVTTQISISSKAELGLSPESQLAPLIPQTVHWGSRD
ncbi:hypothetical protein Pcinc_022903 [Petrolisthes cinctipes]|uniref:Uncharacterized protein n=1 Tax=Petrolisthes cinctipes TaxID=88211 RepID=A0AAE1FEQ8_PETCI|nr:hypothetical protein Pcinc_022903 [Petrolisthes cinctipes]